jgi:hypothetical protein
MASLSLISLSPTASSLFYSSCLLSSSCFFSFPLLSIFLFLSSSFSFLPSLLAYQTHSWVSSLSHLREQMRGSASPFIRDGYPTRCCIWDKCPTCGTTVPPTPLARRQPVVNTPLLIVAGATIGNQFKSQLEYSVTFIEITAIVVITNRRLFYY